MQPELTTLLQQKIKKIAILYNLPQNLPHDRISEELADLEVVETARAVGDVLRGHGFQVEEINLKMEAIESLRQFDWIINLTEQTYGFPLTGAEVAAQLEHLGVPFTGAGSESLQICLAKDQTKHRLAANGILTPRFEVFQPGQEIITKLDYPLFVKPLYEDASQGIFADSVVFKPEELVGRVERIHHRYHQAAIVEEYIEGRDIGVSILGTGADAEVLPFTECVYLEEDAPHFLTYETKWLEDSHAYQYCVYQCPPHLPEETAAWIREFALRAHRLLNCRDYSRVDFRLKGSTPYVLEVNPNPCINPHDAGFIVAGRTGGKSYEEMILSILESSIRSYLAQPRQL